MCENWRYPVTHFHYVVRSVSSLVQKNLDRHFTDDIFRCNFLSEKFCILIKNSLKCVPWGPNDKKQHRLNNGLSPNRRRAIIWINVNPIHWRIYASLGGLVKASAPIAVTGGDQVLSFWPGASQSCKYLIIHLNINVDLKWTNNAPGRYRIWRCCRNRRMIFTCVIAYDAVIL